MNSIGIAMNNTAVTYPDTFSSRLARCHSGGEELPTDAQGTWHTWVQYDGCKR